MATDSTAPYNKVIALTAIGSVIFLVGLKFVLDSYYVYMSEAAAYDKLAPTTAVEKQHAEEQRLLTTAPTPIKAAMADVGRSRNISPLIEPRPSDDIGPMKGWVGMDRVFEAPPATSAHMPQTMITVDGGAPVVAPPGQAPVLPVIPFIPVVPNPAPHH